MAKLTQAKLFLYFFQDLITKLVFKRPEKPIDFLINEMEELKRKGAQEMKKTIKAS